MNYSELIFNFKDNKGFTLLETIIYIAILSLVLLLVSSTIFYFVQSSAKTKGDREVLENARRVLETITYEISGARGVYTPTTTTNQLSLETSRYLPTDESTTYIDFYICNLRICFKKESQNPIFLTSSSVEVSNLTFTRVVTNTQSSIKINITMNYKNMVGSNQPSVNLTSTASLRSY